MGADLRVRWTYGWNLDTLNDDATNRDSGWNWYQNRMRWWMKFKLNDDMDFNIRYAWEFRVWDVPRRKNGNGASTSPRTEGTDFSEIVWDQFNLVVRNLGGMPLTMVVGRQDIRLGEGWLVADAGPGDAARTAYFDALRFTYAIPGKEKTTLDMIYVENRAAEDWYLKPINDRNRVITQQDERAVILYYTDKSRPSLNLEGYFILKIDNPINYAMKATPTGNDRWPGLWSKKANIYTFGGALSGSIGQSEHWKYRAEGAVQTGLSGDDPSTGKNEAFDPLWGEWPRNSEILLYTYNLESMAGEVSNLYRLGFGHSMQLTEKIAMDTDLHLLWADENTRQGAMHSSGLGWSDGGHYRGTLGTWQLKCNFTKNLTGHLLLEYFQPGSYYVSGSRDAAYFMRINMDYTF
jgi:hypothetical protein